MISRRSCISSVHFAHFMHYARHVPSHLGRGRDEKAAPTHGDGTPLDRSIRGPDFVAPF